MPPSLACLEPSQGVREIPAINLLLPSWLPAEKKRCWTGTRGAYDKGAGEEERWERWGWLASSDSWSLETE